MSCRASGGVAPPSQGFKSAAAAKLAATKSNPARKDLSLEFTRGDAVFDAVGVELVEHLAARLGVDVHEIRQLGTGRVQQLQVVAPVVGEPVHFPAAEEALARRDDLRV